LKHLFFLTVNQSCRKLNLDFHGVFLNLSENKTLLQMIFT